MFTIQEYKKLNTKLTKILGYFLNDMGLCKLIKYDNNTPLSMPDFDTTELIASYGDKKQRVYPKLLIPDLVTEQRTQMNVFFSEVKKQGDSFKNMNLIVTTLVGESIDSCENGVRSNELHDRILEIVDKAEGFNLGKVKHIKSKAFTSKNQFVGWEMTFECCEFK